MWGGNMVMNDLQKLLEREGYIGIRQITNGEWIGIMRMNYTYGLCVGMDESGYKGRYCYERILDAMTAARVYEGEGDPIGPWIKYKGEDEERMGPGAKEKVGWHLRKK
jgi:hypothetical protein